MTIKDMELDDVVATIQELKEITLDDFRMTHNIDGRSLSSDLVLTDSDLDFGDSGMHL